MLDKYHQNKQFAQDWQEQGVKVHRQNMLNRRNQGKADLKFEMAQKANRTNRATRTREVVTDMVQDSIDSFEMTLRRLGPV